MASGPVGRKIPNGIQNNLGDGRLEKGNWYFGEEKIYLIAWDFAKECTGDKCPLNHLCRYKETWQMRQSNNCMLHQRYLKNVIHAVIQKMQDKKDFSQEDIIKLGYQLIPLYDQLFKFKMWEYTNEELVYVSEKGTPKVHPIYKEIRETIKSISGVWREIGGQSKTPPNPGEIGDDSFAAAVNEGETTPSEEVSQEGTGMDLENNTVDEKPKRRKKSGKKKKKPGGNMKGRKTKREVPKYGKHREQSQEDEE